MNFEVVNRDICVGSITCTRCFKFIVLMVGDTNSIQLTSLFDTPPESLIIGPFVLTPLGLLMLTRISKVGNIKVKSVIFASTLQIGDSNEINGLARVLAVQRQREVFFSNEGDFSLFKIFSYPLPLPPINEPLTIHTTSLNPDY